MISSREGILSITVLQATGLRGCILEAWTDRVVGNDPGQEMVVRKALADLLNPATGDVVRIADLVLIVEDDAVADDTGQEGLKLVRDSIVHTRQIVEDWEMHARLRVYRETFDQLLELFLITGDE